MHFPTPNNHRKRFDIIEVFKIIFKSDDINLSLTFFWVFFFFFFFFWFFFFYLHLKQSNPKLRFVIVALPGLFFYLFSSPEPKAQGEPLWSPTVRPSSSSSSVCPSTTFKQHLLLNYWLCFDQTSQEWSLVGPLSKLFKWFRSIAYLGHRS